MNVLTAIDWRSAFVPTVPLGELVLRGTIVYFSLFLVFRVLRRRAGAFGISDLVVVVLIADATQNAMSKDYKSITEGLILVGTIAFWDYLLDWLDYRFPSLRPLLHPQPLLLVKDGRLLRRNLRKEMITEDELMEKIREKGHGELKGIRSARLEGDGRISVVTTESGAERSSGPG